MFVLLNFEHGVPLLAPAHPAKETFCTCDFRFRLKLRRSPCGHKDDLVRIRSVVWDVCVCLCMFIICVRTHAFAILPSFAI